MVSGSPRETDRVEEAGPFSASELGTSEGVVCEPLLKTDGVVLGTSVLVSAPGMVANEAVICRTSEEISGVEMIVPLVLVLVTLPDVLRRVHVPEAGVETVVVRVAVEVVFRAVVSALSIQSFGSPVGLADDVGATCTWTGPVTPPWAASLGIFVIRSTTPSVLVSCVECGGS